MSLEVLKPHNGSVTHLFDSDEEHSATPYVKDSPNGSLCGRAPYPQYSRSYELDELTCWRCKRAFGILSKYLVPSRISDAVPVQIEIPKKKKVRKSSTSKKGTGTHRLKAGSSTGTKVKSSKKSHSTRGNRK